MIHRPFPEGAKDLEKEISFYRVTVFYSAKAQRCKGTKIFILFFVPLSLCAFALKISGCLLRRDLEPANLFPLNSPSAGGLSCRRRIR
jgi:hypothetical protein